MRTFALTLVTALAAMAVLAIPASAHTNAKADRFVGPATTSPAFLNAHSGIECASLKNPNIASLGLPCPAR